MFYNMENNIDDQLLEQDNEYVIITKSKEDILNDLDFVDDEERFLCDSIISNLEEMVSDNVRDMKCAQIPHIGCIRINPIKRQLRDSKLHLRAIRKSVSKSQYKDHVRDYVNTLKEQQKETDRIKLVFNRIRSKNKKRYETLFKNCGKTYAELFIKAIYWLDEVPFDAEWEEHYQSLKD